MNMDNTPPNPPIKKTNGLNPKGCEYAKPYMVDNGVLDIYACTKYGGNCYYEPNGGTPFKKICEEV